MTTATRREKSLGLSLLNVELSLPIFRLPLAVFIPWRGAAGFDRRAGWHPRCWCVGSRAAPAFFFLALWAAVELPGRSRPAPGVVDLRRGTQCRALAPDFPAAALAVFIPWRGAAGFDWRAGWHPRSWCVGSRAAPAFFFLVFCLAGRRATGSIAAGTWRRRHSPGYSMSSSRSRFSGCPLAVFIPWRGPDGFDRRAGWHPRSGVLDRGRRRLFSF